MTTASNVSGIIVLDGADGVGKSTLANHFIKEYGARYLHCGLYKDVFSRHIACLRLAERWASRGELVVIDRLYLSELAYGDSLRGGAKHPISIRCFDRLLLRMGAVQVICIQKDIQAHLARFVELKKKRDEKFNSQQVFNVMEYFLYLTGNHRENDLACVSTNYAATFRESLNARVDVMVCEFEEQVQHFDSCIEAIINRLHHLRSEQHPAGLSVETPNLCGNTVKADYLIVGEGQPFNNDISRKIRYPFISRDDKSSSALWLNRALDNLSIPESKLVLTNAIDLSYWKTSDEVKSLVDESRYKWKRVVALGRVAATRLFELGWKEDHDFVVIPHPRYAVNFKHRDHRWWWYTQVLGEALGVKE